MVRLAALIVFSGCLVSVCPGFAQEPKSDDFDVKQMEGDWEYVSGKSGGADIPADRLVGKLKISKDTIVMESGDGEFVIPIKIESKKQPVKITMTIKESPFGPLETPTPGLLRVDGDMLTLGYLPNGGDLPEKLESTADNGLRVLVLKRAKKAE